MFIRNQMVWIILCEKADRYSDGLPSTCLRWLPTSWEVTCFKVQNSYRFKKNYLVKLHVTVQVFFWYHWNICNSYRTGTGEGTNLAGAVRHTAKISPRGNGPYIRVGITWQLVHARLVAEDGSPLFQRAKVHRQRHTLSINSIGANNGWYLDLMGMPFSIFHFDTAHAYDAHIANRITSTDHSKNRHDGMSKHRRKGYAHNETEVFVKSRSTTSTHFKHTLRRRHIHCYEPP